MKKLLIFLLISLITFSCSKTNNIINWEPEIPNGILTKDGRVLGISPSQSDRAFENVFKDLKDIGVGRVELNLEWSYFEEDVGQYQDPLGLLEAISFYGSNNIEIGLSIATINTVKRTDPLELQSLAYDDPRRLQAFDNLVDWILIKIGNKVKVDYISVGNEVDFILNGDEWSSFISFLESAKKNIHESHPEINVGVKITIGKGILGPYKDQALELIEMSDLALLNYYPQNDQFQVYAIDRIEQELDLIRTLINKPIYFTEVGFQSGDEFCKSSEEKQAIFFHFLFSYWDQYPTEIPFININWIDDVSQEELMLFENYYGYSDPAFKEYLATLGLKTSSGKPKYAWKQIKTETEYRNW